MPAPSQMAVSVALKPEFQGRIRLALVRTALVALDDADAGRAAYARKVLTDRVNLYMAAVAVVANASIGAAIAAVPEGTPDDTYGVDDGSIAYTVAENGDPATGIFAKLATADAG